LTLLGWTHKHPVPEAFPLPSIFNSGPTSSTGGLFIDPVARPASCAASATQCGSKPVSSRGLPKTGIFRHVAGDFRRFGPESDQNSEPGDDSQFAKVRHWRAFLWVKGTFSLSVGLPGWRRSADRTRLPANSLLTGNFTGNFAILKLRDTIWYQETAALQPLSEQFPTQINRENILRIRELFSGNREF
jgi:hypothetical protein